MGMLLVAAVLALILYATWRLIGWVLALILYAVRRLAGWAAVLVVGGLVAVLVALFG